MSIFRKHGCRRRRITPKRGRNLSQPPEPRPRPSQGTTPSVEAPSDLELTRPLNIDPAWQETVALRRPKRPETPVTGEQTMRLAPLVGPPRKAEQRWRQEIIPWPAGGSALDAPQHNRKALAAIGSVAVLAAGLMTALVIGMRSGSDVAAPSTQTSLSAPAVGGATPDNRTRQQGGGGPARPSQVLKLADNPLNAVGAAELANCVLPTFGQDKERQDAFYIATVKCLNTAWEPVLRAAGLPFEAPNVVNVTGTQETPCGSRNQQQTALYCDGTIYMTSQYYRDVEKLGARQGRYLAVLAHEYGHHVQRMSGILQAEWDKRYEVGTESDQGLELSRRAELQATCFGGMFIARAHQQRVIADSVVNDALSDLGTRGDDNSRGAPRDHGTVAHNRRWAEAGLSALNTSLCNTWAASSADVN
ncbi:hypothetical protein D5S17_31245 [Pseudonocardiaceae bacterium YIM PH 21723]|nr:hypothetical protein D5S17_31245 [Pseudonocardiaceae bacterium YIM PH 21723]